MVRGFVEAIIEEDEVLLLLGKDQKEKKIINPAKFLCVQIDYEIGKEVPYLLEEGDTIDFDGTSRKIVYDMMETARGENELYDTKRDLSKHG